MRLHAARADAALVAIVAGGLVLRIAYTLALGQHVSLGFSDGSFYWGGANALADGKGYIDILRTLETGEALPTAHHPPGWPALLAVFSLAGVDTQLGHRLIGCVVGAVVILAIGLLGRRIGGRAVGTIAAAVAAVHPTLVAADGSLMSETFGGLLVLAVLLAALRVVDRPSAARAAVLGIAIGAAALVRGEALLYALLIVVPLGVTVARRAVGSWGAFVRVGGLAAVGVMGVVLPWTARNAIQLDGFVLVSINESSVLAGANCDGVYQGPGIGAWDFSCASGDGELRSEVEQAARGRKAGVTYAQDHVDRLPVVIGARVLRTWGFFGSFPAVAEGRHEGVQTAGTLVWLVGLLPLGVVGAVVLARRRRRMQLAVLLAPVGAALFVSIVGFGMLRFRHSMELVTIVLAAVALEAGRGLVRYGAGQPTGRVPAPPG